MLLSHAIFTDFVYADIYIYICAFKIITTHFNIQIYQEIKPRASGLISYLACILIVRMLKPIIQIGFST